MTKQFRESQIEFYIWAIEHYSFAIGGHAAKKEYALVMKLNGKALNIRERAQRELSRPINEGDL